MFVTLFDEEKPKKEIISQEIVVDGRLSTDGTTKSKTKKGSEQVFFLTKNIDVNDYPIETYLECGMKVDLTYAIDLTISNGNFMIPTEKSLHRMQARYDGQVESVYSRIMSEIGRKFDAYMKSGTVSDTLGFGARLNRDTEANQCINFGNGMVGTMGAIHAYAQGLQYC